MMFKLNYYMKEVIKDNNNIGLEIGTNKVAIKDVRRLRESERKSLAQGKQPLNCWRELINRRRTEASAEPINKYKIRPTA